MGGGRARRGQVSIEYLFMMGFTLLLIAPLIIVYYDQTHRLTQETAGATIERAARQIVEAADTVYYLGSPSMRTITVDLPESVKALAIGGTSVIFTVTSTHGDYEMVAWSVANLTGSFGTTRGPHVLVLTAEPDNTVSITER